ncbi:MAG: tetratricopeptide repeat protein [Candidatus Kaiserbacteria bacterium]|nr:tetratricopeptide repeat protein [Candidatus Kaiserbacteria bacterium]
MPPQQLVSSSRRSLDTISTWALLITVVAALFVILPFLSVPFATTKTFLLGAGALITLALYILARLTRGNVVFPSSVLLGALWLPVAAYALSSAFSGVSFANAFWGTALETDTLGFMLIAACLGTLSALVLRRPEHYKSFLKVAAGTFVAAAVIEMLIVIVGQFAPTTISPAFSFIGSFSDLASLLGLGVIILLITFRFVELETRMYRILLAGGVLSLFLLAVANSSLVWTLLALVSLGLFVESIMRRGGTTHNSDLDGADIMGEIDDAPAEEEKGNSSLVMPLSVLAISLFFLISGTLGGALANALHVNVLNIRPSWQSTFEVAQKAYGSSSVFGSGPTTFGSEWLKYRDAGLNSTVFWNIDFSSGIGFIPTSFVTTGIVGALAWIAFIVLFLVFGLRTLILRTPQDAFIRYVSIVSFVGLVYVFTLALFDLPNTVILTIGFLFAGLFVSTTRYAANGRQWGVLFSRSPRLGFAIVFSLTILLLSSVVAAYTLVEHYVATTQFANAATALGAGDLDKADVAAQNAIAFAPSAALYQIQSSIAEARMNLIVSSSTMEKAAAQKAYQTALSTGINAALTATNLNPSDYQNWLALGNLYAQAVPLGVSGAYDSAKTAYKKAQTLNPTNPQISYIMAQLNIANKDTKAAQADLKAAIALKQDYTAAIFLLSQLEVQDGNVKDALASALAAAYFTPNDPNILFQVGILSAASEDYASAAAALSAAVGANPQFANARYFLSAVYAKQGDFKNALVEMKAIAAMSADNAKAVESQLAALEAGKSPFPANLLSISAEPVKPAAGATAPAAGAAN